MMEQRAALAGDFNSAHLGRRFTVYHEGNTVTGLVHAVKHGTKFSGEIQSEITLKSDIGLCFLHLSADHPVYELVQDSTAAEAEPIEDEVPVLENVPKIENPLKSCPMCGHAFHAAGACYNMASDNDCNCGGVIVTVT